MTAKIKIQSKPRTGAPKKVLVDETIGRPAFPYSKEMADEICQAISTTTDSLATICKKNPHFPSRDTISLWRVTQPEFSVKYFEAKRFQVHLFAEETFDLSDNADEDSPGSIAKRKMQIENRRWYASRLIPRMYGDKVQTEAKVTLVSHEDALKELE